jgi:hypothetical protein
MEHFTLTNDDDNDIEFDGERIGNASSRDHYRSDTRWTVYGVYRTNGGTLIGEILGYSQWQGESLRCKARVCKSEKELVEFFGLSDSAKEALNEAGIKTSITVE